MFGAGTWGRAGGVYLALNVDWSLVSVPLAWTYRAVAPGTLPWRVNLRGGFAVGAFIAGFLQGLVLFWSLPIDLGAPFGGQRMVGAASALLLWLWLRRRQTQPDAKPSPNFRTIRDYPPEPRHFPRSAAATPR